MGGSALPTTCYFTISKLVATMRAIPAWFQTGATAASRRLVMSPRWGERNTGAEAAVALGATWSPSNQCLDPQGCSKRTNPTGRGGEFAFSAYEVAFKPDVQCT